MRFRKAQAAMEFLMTYGWAILVVLAAIGALAYFGVLSPDRFLPDKCLIQGGFSCSDEIIDSSNDEIRFKVINNLGITANTVNVSFSSGDCTLAPGDDSVAAGNMDNRDVFQASFNCTNTLSGVVDGDITVQYIRSDGTEVRSATGTISGRPQ